MICSSKRGVNGIQLYQFHCMDANLTLRGEEVFAWTRSLGVDEGPTKPRVPIVIGADEYVEAGDDTRPFGRDRPFRQEVASTKPARPGEPQ